MATFGPKELAALPPADTTHWIIDGVLRTRRKRPSLLCGYPESGKSTMAMQIAIAVAQGIPLLGRQTERGHVIYWKNEDSEQDIRDDFFKAGMSIDDPLTFVLPEAGQDNFEVLKAEIEKRPDTNLVIVETLADFTGIADITSNDDTRIALEKFSKTIMQPRLDCAFLILHHFNKSTVDNELAAKRILGGTAIVGGTDAKLYLKQVSDTDSRRILWITVRKGKPIEPTYLNFDPATLTACLGETVKQEAIASKQIAKAQKEFGLETSILRYVREHAGISKWEAVHAIGGNTQKMGWRIDALIKSGSIVEMSGGQKGTAKQLYVAGAEPPNDRSSETALEGIPL